MFLQSTPLIIFLLIEIHILSLSKNTLTVFDLQEYYHIEYLVRLLHRQLVTINSAFMALIFYTEPYYHQICMDVEIKYDLEFVDLEKSSMNGQ